MNVFCFSSEQFPSLPLLNWEGAEQRLLIYETHTRFIKTFKDLIHFIRALNLGKHFLKKSNTGCISSLAPFCAYLRAVKFGLTNIADISFPTSKRRWILLTGLLYITLGDLSTVKIKLFYFIDILYVSPMFFKSPSTIIDAEDLIYLCVLCHFPRYCPSVWPGPDGEQIAVGEPSPGGEAMGGSSGGTDPAGWPWGWLGVW